MNILVTTKIVNDITTQPLGTEISELNENGLNMGIKCAVNYFGGNAIGVVPFGDQTKVEPYNEKAFYEDKLYQHFSQEELDKALFLVKNSDGLVLPGGLETRPYELLLARFAYSMKKPILGICAGQNVLVRALGGSTKQLSLEETKKHNNPKVHKVHGASAVPGSDFEKIVGSGTFAVNSIHSFVIDNPGPQLSVLAYDDEGHIEVVGNNDLSNHFVIASRFHPETIFRQIVDIKKQGGSKQEIDAIIEDNKSSFMMFKEFSKACARTNALNTSIVDINDPKISEMIYPDLEECYVNGDHI